MPAPKDIITAMSSLRISVVVPTYKRVELLRRNLHALMRQTLPASQYEVIVAYQDESDGTGELLRTLAAAHPNLRYLPEPRPGVAHARNAGLYAARGEIVVCTDDDAFAPPEWLETILRTFAEVEPTPHVVGGPILPLVIGRRPAWFRDQYELRSWGDSARFLGPEDRRFPTGNVAHRRDLLLAAGGFDPALGMKGDIMGFAEDDEIFDRLQQTVSGDLLAYYQPRAYVWHAVPDEKMRLTYRMKRSFVSGQTRHQLALRSARRTRAELFCRETYRLVCATLRALARPPRISRCRDWVIERVLPVMNHTGYLAAALGLRMRVRRA